jgi:hypothetical protein
VSVPLIWGDLGDLTVLAANQFIAQLSSPRPEGGFDEVVLTVGYAAPPVLLGAGADLRRQASELESVPVRPLSRYSLTQTKAEELYGVLGRVLELARRASSLGATEDA